MTKSKSIDVAFAQLEGGQEVPPRQQQKSQQRRKQRGRNTRRTSGTQHSKTIERNLLMRYLKEYRDLVLDRYKGSSSKRRKMASPMMSSIEPIVIGQHQFPRFDDYHDDIDGDSLCILDRPYLPLPSGLSPGIRATTHELCVELGLFHCSVGEVDSNERYVAISVFRDGLALVAGVADSPVILAEKYKPWIMRKEIGNESSSKEILVDDQLYDASTKNVTDGAINTTQQATKHGKEKIMELVDQPSLCWRDGIDEMDLIVMKDKDLSDARPPDRDDPNFTLVNTAERMTSCIRDLVENKPTELAFDLEGYCKSKDLQLTCLIQLATNDGREYVIDVLAEGVWDCVGGLSIIFSDASVVKIGHGIGGLDVQSLHRDFGIFVVNAFDTHEAAKALRLKEKGLAKICRHYGMPFGGEYISLKDEYQNCDWTRRPLTVPMIQYGRYDVRYLPKIRHLMIRDLILLDRSIPLLSSGFTAMKDMIETFNQEDGIEDLDEAGDVVLSHIEGNQHFDRTLDVETVSVPEVTYLDAKNLRMQLALMQVISTSQDRCSELWSYNWESHKKNNMLSSLTSKGKKNGDHWTLAQFDLYESLASWREQVAELEECMPGFVCQFDFLAMIAHHRPGTVVSLRKLVWHIPRLLTRNNEYHIRNLLSLVQESREADNLEDETIPPSYEEYRERIEAKKKSYWDTEWMLLLGIATSCAVTMAVWAALSRARQGRYS
jgi:ribonuclease D